MDVAALVARELALPFAAVSAVVSLLESGATVPFIARYRKEATSGLDEVAIRNIRDRQAYLGELAARKATVLEEIAKQDKLTPGLRKAIEQASTKAALEDLYAPFKTKRRTRAVMARERGLEPLADRIGSQPHGGSPRSEAARFVSAERDVADVDAALAGARDICAERIADDAAVRHTVRETFAKHAALEVKKTKEHRAARTKFDDYADYRELGRNVPSHRYLAIQRGEKEGVLKVAVSLEPDDQLRARIAQLAGLDRRSPWASELQAAVDDGYQRLIAARAAAELRSELKDAAELAAVSVFAKNLRELLLAAPYGAKSVLGIDPGQRTGCKCAAIGATGQLLGYDTMFLVQGDQKLAAAREVLLGLCRKHRPSAIAVGNGTHGRETEAFVRDVLREAGLDILTVSVSEAGASVYSASDVAREELPDIDVSVRGAVSIGRRLQDPLAELVKIDPKSIGVGQYQHDLPTNLLASKLDEVVEDCVNGVGVDLNTASVPLLSHVAGLGPKLAERVVQHRHERGGFRSRKELLKVSGLGHKTFEQAAGFLRIRGGEHPLDASAVHPERYALVERMARELAVPVASLVGNGEVVDRIDPARYLADDVGRFTLEDILAELKKPGRDPRASFEPPKFRDDVRTLEDLREGMELEGVVTNVTSFGAFVDLGVKQDGLVHISQLADRFVKDPSEVVHVGDRLTVRVLSVDLERKRVGLTARKDGAPARAGDGQPRRDGAQRPDARHDTRGRQAPRQSQPGREPSQEQRRHPQGQPAPRRSFENRPFAKLEKKR